MPKLKRFSTKSHLLGLCLALSCVLPAPLFAKDQQTIVAVNYALSYFAERLTDEGVEVLFPVPEGSDPSFWNPSIAAISAMQQADLILLNGAGFATWTTKASLPRSRIVDTSRGVSDQYIKTETVTHSHGDDGEHSHTGTATYTWLDQHLALAQAEAIAAALESKSLVGNEDLGARLSTLRQELSALDTAADELRALAVGKRVIATHPRYQYLARAYGLEIQYLEWDAGAAPDAEQLAQLQRLAEETGAEVFIWEAAPPDAARDAVRSLGLTDVVFPTLASAPPSGDYVESFDMSVDDLKAALRSVGG